MSIKSALGLESSKKVRYGIVALGDISQASLMPAVKGTDNSVITALVTGDPTKAREVAKQYDVPDEAVYSYEQFDKLLTSGQVDALYVATPNWQHEQFTVPALRAGIHVLLEKPMEVSVEACQRILDAQRGTSAKMMIAYRLHFEPATLAAIQSLRDGEIGEVRSFTSTFSQLVDPANHRVTNGEGAGVLLDMGPYPINAVRNLFGAEPIEVFAVGSKSADAGLPMDFNHTVTVVLKFPGERVANFVVSYVAEMADTFTVIGSKGTLEFTPAYGFGKPKVLTRTIEKKPNPDTYKPTDHFGGELRNFSDCILENRDPEPDGEEGLLDVRVIEAVLKSIATGAPVKLEPRQRSKRIDTARAEKQSMPWSTPKEINAASPGKQ